MPSEATRRESPNPIDAGILDVLGPVGSREEFARRLIAIGIVDRSDAPL